MGEKVQGEPHRLVVPLEARSKHGRRLLPSPRLTPVNDDQRLTADPADPKWRRCMAFPDLLSWLPLVASLI